MRTILLSLLFSALPCLSPLGAADEKQPEPTREGQKEGGVDGERLRAEKQRFHEELETHMKATMEEAARLEAEGKPDAADKLRSQAKERTQAAIQAFQAKVQGRTGGDQRNVAADQAARTLQALQAKTQERAGGDQRRGGADQAGIERRLRHVEQAIAHLREADLPEPAENLERLANRLRSAPQSKEAPREEGVRREEPRREGDIDALRREIAELRQIVRKLAERQSEP